MKGTTRIVPTALAGIALAVGGIGIAQASNGADDPPGHDITAASITTAATTTAVSITTAVTRAATTTATAPTTAPTTTPATTTATTAPTTAEPRTGEGGAR